MPCINQRVKGHLFLLKFDISAEFHKKETKVHMESQIIRLKVGPAVPSIWANKEVKVIKSLSVIAYYLFMFRVEY